MSDATAPQLYARRITPSLNYDFTVGKVYEVKNAGSVDAQVLTDTGDVFFVGRYGDNVWPARWQFFWLMPDGTELEALE
jgi:hypothetical protein